MEVHITTEARYEGRYLVLEEPLNLPEGQRVRVTIVPVEDLTAGQRVVAQWRQAGVVGAWAHQKPDVPSTRFARLLRQKAIRRRR